MEQEIKKGKTETDRVDLNQLISESALRLMPASLQSAESLSQKILAYLSDYFDVSVAFYRRNDREKRLSILVAEWPVRENIPDPDPLAVIHFDDNPIFGMSEHLKSSVMLVPGDPHTEMYQEMIAKAAGLEKVTAICVPLLSAENTEGMLGLVREGNRAWSDDEVFALQSIATMFMQTQSRLLAERALRKAAYIDSLTGLPNTKGLLERGRNMLEYMVPTALIQIDLQDLRSVNDTLGRQAGDKLITQFSSLLREHGFGMGWCGRINGNGFALLMEDPGDEESLLLKAHQLHEALSVPVQIGERHITLSLRLGISRTYGRQISADDLFQEANAAVHSNARGPDEHVFLFDQARAEEKRLQVEMEIALQDAVDSDDQIIVHYQPEVDLRTGLLVGCEALARWQHPEMGLLAAGRFIEMAERTGLVVPLSRKVLEKAIAQQAQWQREDPTLNTTIRINVSPAQLMGTDLAEDVNSLLLKYALPADNLCIEVTEHVVMDYSDRALGALARLREQGVEVAIDDFGIGHSSIAKLKYMPADTLKIDRAFITSLVDTDRDRALVDTIIRMAAAFNMTVVAEGVETPEELTELLQMDADRGQGYFFAKPMSAEDVKKLFHQRLFNPSSYSEKKKPLLAQG